MAKFRYTMNHGGIRSVLAGGGTRAALTSVAEDKLAAAQASAPVRTGAYRAGLHIEQSVGGDGRARVIVAGGTDYDAVVEANTGNLLRTL